MENTIIPIPREKLAANIAHSLAKDELMVYGDEIGDESEMYIDGDEEKGYTELAKEKFDLHYEWILDEIDSVSVDDDEDEESQFNTENIVIE